MWLNIYDTLVKKKDKTYQKYKEYFYILKEQINKAKTQNN